MSVRINAKPTVRAPNGAGATPPAPGLTLRQVLNTVGIKVAAREGFDLALLDRVRLTPPVMEALYQMKNARVVDITFFPLHQEALARVFGSPDLPGMTVDRQSQSRRVILTQPLTDYLSKRGYQVLGNQTFLQGLHLTKPVSDALFAWDKNGVAKVLKFGKRVTREQVAAIFSTPALAGARLTPEGLFIDGPEEAPAEAAVQRGALAGQLEEAKEKYPEKVALEIRCAFQKPVPHLLSAMERIRKMAESVEPDKRKPCREVLRGLLREHTSALIAHFPDNEKDAAEKFTPLFAVMAALGSLDFIDALLKEAQRQDKLVLFTGIVDVLTNDKKLGPVIGNSDKARFRLAMGKLNEGIEAYDEARDCYAAAARLDPGNKDVRRAPRELENKLIAQEAAIRREFLALWEKAESALMQQFTQVDSQIHASFMSAHPECADEFKRLSSGDRGALFNRFRSDCFAVAQHFKSRLFAPPAAIEELAVWLNNHYVSISQTVLKEICEGSSSLAERPAAYSILTSVLSGLKEASLQQYGNDLKEKILGNFLERMSRGNRFGFIEGFLLCLAIEDGLVFPDWKPLLDKLLNSSDRMVGEKGFAALAFADQIYYRLYSAPNRRAIEAAQEGNLALLEKCVEQIVKASPPDEEKTIRALNYANAVDEFAEVGRFDLAEQYIEKIRALDATSRHLERALASYCRYKKEYSAAIEHMEAALTKTPRPESIPMAQTALTFYVRIFEEYERDQCLRRALELAAHIYSVDQCYAHSCCQAALICDLLGEQENFLLWTGRFVAAQERRGDVDTAGVNALIADADSASLLDKLRKVAPADEKIKALIAALEKLAAVKEE